MDQNYDIGLPEFIVIDRVINADDDYIYTIELKDRPAECPSCGSKLHIHKTTMRHVQDLPERTHRVGLIINSHRYRCSNKECNATVGEEYPSIYSSGKMTNRLREEVKRESFFQTFKPLAEKYGISVPAVSDLFQEKAKELNNEYSISAPRILGIDEVHLKKSYCGVYVDIEEGRVIEMTETRSKKIVSAFLLSLSDRNKIECVTMDMWRPYKDAVEEVLPKVPIVIDKFHVIKELNKEFDDLRKAITRAIKETKVRKSLKNNRFLLLRASEALSPKQNMLLNDLLKAYPQLECPYLLKEAFRNIYLADNRTEAEALFEDWIVACHEQGIYGFDTFISMVRNWHKEIFNYFDYPYTNATTESLNHKIGELDMAGRGYSFEVLRDKIVLQHMVVKKSGKVNFDLEAKTASEE